MTEDEALALIRDCVAKVVPARGESVDLDTDLVKDEILDSLDVMSFLFELEQELGRKLTAITEEYDDFRVAALIALVRESAPGE